MLFARKFDPLNPGSMELVKKVEEWRMEEEIRYNSSDRHEGSHRRFMMRVIPKRSNISNPDDLYFGVHRDLCVSTNGMLAGKMTLSQCDAYNEHQWFYLDQCHGNAHVYLRDGQVPVLYPEFGVDISKEFEPYSVCQIVLDGSKLCLDINGQNYAPGADLIGYVM